MKNIFTIILLASITCFSAQVIIGDAVGTVAPANKGSVLLEFALGNKGIIVPYVKVLPTSAPVRVEGTILLDVVNPSKARMKFYNANTAPGTNGWFDLSGQDGNASAAVSTQPATTEPAGAKSIIGARVSTADGVLVLESNTKAMVLPQVDKVSDILSPSPGMMVYVKGINPTYNKRLAVYNGTTWSFWKP
ncbi:hypothetical protein IV494_09015 [Kaistella sp. G5-32]|uniref:DUF5666 domain-containing protein n=1 Tax=Kaistella gelatinilytica TaxID=2787636 RepID=A0ABS0FC70_9FLAO|nr:hypothetical protein [Kaistella gelatinilytica]MBF8457323.1 hypothetical protein [Kaistella gelatinilytica]